jgi:2-polyprenyl-3-methyl-5-hydroxy-6-metoxy-1,4-benzoquinol methylase
MTAGGYVDHEAASGTFSIPPEHALTLTEPDDSNYMAAFLCWIPSLGGVVNQVIESFQSGGGVPYEYYGGDGLEAIGNGNKPMFLNDYVSKWIPAIPDMSRKLESGGKIADIGCGLGWSSISLAKGYPTVHIDAFDNDEESIDQAIRNAEQNGVSDQVQFHLVGAEQISTRTRYDLVTAFECIHDMAYPVKALAKMKEILASDGSVLLSEEAVGDSLEENKNFFGHLMYNFSVLHCLPQTMVFPDSAAIGTVMRPSILKDLSAQAGFSDFEILPIENAFWRFYLLNP